jgi:hypothetical protein
MYNEIFSSTEFFLLSTLHYLCCRVKHLRVQTKAELHDALVKSKAEQIDCVVEVDNSIDSNADFHRFTSKLNYFFTLFYNVLSTIYLRFY